MNNPVPITLPELSTELTDTVTLSSVSDTAVSWNWQNANSGIYDSLTSSITSTGAVTGSTYNGPYTISSGTSTTAPWMTSSPAGGRITLTGKDADIEVNGWSLMDAVKRIEERLAIMQPNPELEKEWAELKDLGEQYRKLEQHIQDKQATWDRLKAMPRVDID
jgi:hypothetical protein